MANSNLTLKSCGNGGFSLHGDGSDDLVLCWVKISFPHITSHAGGKITHHIAGGASVSVGIRDSSNQEKTISDIPIEW